MERKPYCRFCRRRKDQIHFARDAGAQPACRQCRRRYWRRYYFENGDRLRKANRERQKRKRAEAKP